MGAQEKRGAHAEAGATWSVPARQCHCQAASSQASRCRAAPGPSLRVCLADERIRRLKQTHHRAHERGGGGSIYDAMVT